MSGRLPAATLAIVIALATAGCGSSGGSSASTASTPPTPGSTSAPSTAAGSTATPPPDTAPSAHGPTGGSGEPVHGIKCEGKEFVATHTHTSLAIFLDGQRVAVPAFVGIVDDTCLYWLHTHLGRGLVHAESPSTDRRFTLGDFFAVWGWPLDADHLLGSTGKVYAWLDGQPASGDPAQLPLADHGSIVLSDRPDVTLPKPDFSELG